jgi:predicted peptidase
MILIFLGRVIMSLKLQPEPRLDSAKQVTIKLAWNVSVDGNLFLPPHAKGLVMFAHGSGLCGPDHMHLARVLQRFEIATLTFNLLTPQEADFDQNTKLLRADSVNLGDRLVGATIWLEEHADLRSLNLGILADDVGAAAAMIVAARLPQMVKAIVSRSGNLLSAEAVWPYVKAATLLLVGRNDPVLPCNREALKALRGEKSLEIIAETENLLDDSAGLDRAGELAGQWFRVHLEPKEGQAQLN